MMRTEVRYTNDMLGARRMALTLFVLALLAMHADALAYIDPAAGSLILQALLGGVAGILVVTKLYYRKLMTLLGRRPRGESAPTPEGDPPSR
jgi:hypothetical protein